MACARDFSVTHVTVTHCCNRLLTCDVVPFLTWAKQLTNVALRSAIITIKHFPLRRRSSLSKFSGMTASLSAVQRRNISGSSQAVFLQASVVVVPSAYSEQFETFCELNKGPCPLLYRSKTGNTTAGHLAGDTDIR